MTLREAKEYLGERYILHPLYTRKRNPWHNTARKPNVAKTFARVRARLNAEKVAGPDHEPIAMPTQLVVAKIQRASRMRKPTQGKRVPGEDMLAANS